MCLTQGGLPAPAGRSRDQGSPAVVAQRFDYPVHDCANTGATGGLGSGQVTSTPPSSPAASAGVFPLSILSVEVLPGTQARGACVIQDPFPAQLGGGSVPIVNADP